MRWTLALALTAAALCPVGDASAQARSLLAADTKAEALAKALFDETQTVVDVEPAAMLDGGFRGAIRIVPEPPIHAYRRHLVWSAAALRDIDATLTALPGRDAKRYRHRGVTLRFFRSVGRTTPSAFAIDWRVAYNVSGSLLRDEASVRETLVHEIFHLNDQAHGDWSTRALGADYAAIVKKCGQDVRCLAPYAPGETKVRGGTYYAFQPNNGEGVREYAAELALRFFLEHRAVLHKEPFGRPAFKCAAPENGRAWKALVDEFYGVDLVPPCGAAPKTP